MKAFLKDWFGQTVRSYERPLTRYALNILKSLPLSQDTVQETFLRLWKNGHIEGSSPLRIWLYKTCRNLSIDSVRKEKKMSFLSSEEEDKLLCPEQMPCQKIEKDQIKNVILEHINKLPEKSQEIVRLKFQESLSYKEISEVTGYSTSKVGVMLHRSILHLRESMNQGGL